MERGNAGWRANMAAVDPSCYLQLFDPSAAKPGLPAVIVIPANGEVTIGREGTAVLDPGFGAHAEEWKKALLSRQHARLTNFGTPQITDLSLNGCEVDGASLAKNVPTELREGSTIIFGTRGPPKKPDVRYDAEALAKRSWIHSHCKYVFHIGPPPPQHEAPPAVAAAASTPLPSTQAANSQRDSEPVAECERERQPFVSPQTAFAGAAATPSVPPATVPAEEAEMHMEHVMDVDEDDAAADTAADTALGDSPEARALAVACGLRVSVAADASAEELEAAVKAVGRGLKTLEDELSTEKAAAAEELSSLNKALEAAAQEAARRGTSTGEARARWRATVGASLLRGAHEPAVEASLRTARDAQQAACTLLAVRSGALLALHQARLAQLQKRVGALLYADRRLEERAHDDYSERLQSGVSAFQETLEKPDDYDCECRYERRNYGYRGRYYDDDDEFDDDNDCDCWMESSSYACVDELITTATTILGEIKMAFHDGEDEEDEEDEGEEEDERSVARNQAKQARRATQMADRPLRAAIRLFIFTARLD